MSSTTPSSEAFKIPTPCSKCGYISGGLCESLSSYTIPSSLLRSNYAPGSASDRSFILDTISSSNTSLKVLEAERKKLEESLELVKKHIFATRAFQDAQTSLLSPIRKLPDEILGEIFIHSATNYSGQVEAFNLFKKCDPISNLEQVCLHWQKAVQSTTPLWASFSLSGNCEITAPAVALRIRSRLNNSRGATLEMFLTPGKAADIPLSSLNDIVQQLHRWGTLVIRSHLYYRTFKKTGLKSLLLEGRASQLRDLRLIADDSHVGHSLHGYSIFSNAPVLEHLFFSEFDFETFTLRSTSVKKLGIRECWFCSESAFRTMLLSIPLLEEFSWTQNSSCLVPLSTPITLPSLRTIFIEIQDNELNPPWSVIRAPSLKTLSVMDVTEDLSPYSYMLQTSKCALQKLELGVRSYRFFYEFIKECRDIIELSVFCFTRSSDNDEPTARQVLSRLVWNPAGDSETSQMLPNLQKLEISPDSDVRADVVVPYLMDIMRSRSPSGIPVNTDNGEHQHPVPLVFLKYELEFPEYDEPSIYALEDLGEELGIEVEAKVFGMKRIYVSDSEDNEVVTEQDGDN